MTESTQALYYYDLGWRPVWLPSNEKAPPPPGTTGYLGIAPTRKQLEQVLAIKTAPRAWAFRLEGSVGLDVDAYKDDGAAFLDLLDRFGPLPPTVMSTARTDGMSGIRFYRVPEGTFLKTNPAATIEMIQQHHRYAVVAPSMHTKIGDPYRFIDEASGDVIDLPPRPCELPELPQPWLDGLGSTAPRHNPQECATIEELVEFLETHTAARARGLLGKIEHRLANYGGSRHDTLVEIACWAMREAGAGFYPALDAKKVLERWWLDVMDDPDRRDGDEFADALSWATAQVTPEAVAETQERFEKWRRADIARKNRKMDAWLARCSS